MASKRNRGLTVLDRGMPVPLNHRKDPSTSNDTETTRLHSDNRHLKENIISILAGSNDISKLATSARSNVEILRANSPTLKRLIGVRVKLDRYVNSMSHTISTSQQSIHSSNHEKPTTATTTNVRVSSSKKPIKSKTAPSTGPLDKITYEKTWTHNGSPKKKCSLEIWLPKPSSDDDDDNNDDDGNIAWKTPLNSNLTEKKCQSPQPTSTKSRRSSIVKMPNTIAVNNEIKPLEETVSTKPESTVVPRVYHYEDYLTDQSEERPRSSKSSRTIKSDSKGANNGVKRQSERSHNRRLSISTNHTEETVQSTKSEVPMTSKNLFTNIKKLTSDHEKKTKIKSNNSLMINELVRKYSSIKKNHQELTQAKLNLEKTCSDLKTITNEMKDESVSTFGSISYTSSDYLTVSVKKLFGDNSPPRSAKDRNNNNMKMSDRRSAQTKPSNSDILPQTRLFSIVKHRQASASMSTNLLPVVVGKKNDDRFPYLERIKTLEILSDISTTHQNKTSSYASIRPDSSQIVTNSANIVKRKTYAIEQIAPRIPKRSIPPAPLNHRLEEQQPILQLVQYQNIQNSAQRYHHSENTSATTSNISTDKVHVHLKYSNSGNIDRKCLVPE